MRKVGGVLLGALFGGMASTAGLPAAAQSEADFYKGKTVTVIIGSTTGGGYDQYGRILARFMGKHLPGNPTLVPKNVPTAGGREAMLHVANLSPKDGTEIGITLRNVAFEPLQGGDSLRNLDAPGLGWIGSMNSETSVCVAWHTAPATGLDGLKATETPFGSSGPSSSETIHAKLLNEIAGTKIKVIGGYPGSTEVHMAMERGEVNGRCGFGWDSILARYAAWLEKKQIVILAQFAVVKHPDLPNVPFIMDLAKTEAAKQLATLLLGPNQMGRPIFAPPGLPAARLATLRRAFDATMKDPEFLAEAQKQKIGIDPMIGEDVAAMVEKIYATPKAVTEQANKLLGAM